LPKTYFNVISLQNEFGLLEAILLGFEDEQNRSALSVHNRTAGHYVLTLSTYLQFANCHGNISIHVIYILQSRLFSVATEEKW
jgi:hypothetical protein